MGETIQCCDKLVHPFQTDPGVDQEQRVVDNLLNKIVEVDARTLADLLRFFVQLSRHINYYDLQMRVTDWQSFFQNSHPFTIADIVNYPEQDIQEKMTLYGKIFDQSPSISGLQLSTHYIFYSTVYAINQWQLKLKHSELPLEPTLELVVRNNLAKPLKQFIRLSNAASKWYCIKRLDFSAFQNNDAWDLDIRDLNCFDESFRDQSVDPVVQLQVLQQSITSLFPTFLEAIRVLSKQAPSSLQGSLLPLKEEFQEKHPPHLSLLFAFLNLFQELQGHLNGFSKKHLDFFYKDILKLKPKEAVPDKAHILFEIQKQLKSHLLKKGLLVKDSKDENKQEIQFSLDEEMVANKTQVADTRTLFLNNQIEQDHRYLEGVYAAQNATMADGLDKPFEDDGPKSFRSLGDKPSKYTPPGKTFFQDYPHGRIGFILASPVLLLNEGSRKINITLACQLQDDICGTGYPSMFSAEQLYQKVKKLFKKTYVLITQDLLDEAIKLGLDTATVDVIKNKFMKDTVLESCEGTIQLYKFKTVVAVGRWRQKFYNARSDEEKEILDQLFTSRRILKLHFSGEKEWIEPSHYKKVKFSTLSANKQFTIKIKVKLDPDKPAVTFYDKEKLLEDFNTELPVVKLELDDNIKLLRGFNLTGDACCLKKPGNNRRRPISFYHFLKHIEILKESGTYKTNIHVKVCGLRNFVVQNDESVQDVNAPIYPFGTRPDINDFNVVNPSTLYCLTQALVDHAVNVIIINAATESELDAFLSISDPYHVGITQEELDDFLINQLSIPADRPKIETLLKDPIFLPKRLGGAKFLHR